MNYYVAQKNATKNRTRACAIFAEALQAFRKLSWDEAKAKFHEQMKNSGEYGLSEYDRKLCEQYEKNPPGQGWDGVIDLEEK